MNGALVILAVNIAVGLIFVAAYAIVATMISGQRRVFCFGASYLVGVMAPVGDILSSIFGHAHLFDWFSYLCFLSGLISMALSFQHFHRRPVQWSIALAVLAIGIVLRVFAATLPYGTLAYGFTYQAGFVLASVFDTVTVLRAIRQNRLYPLLFGVFAITTAHFLLKPLLLARFGGHSLNGYTKTLYALFSQAGTGVLLLACGMVLLLLVSQQAIADSQQASETDALSGLSNRRGFDRVAQAMLRKASQQKIALTAAIFDIDHFKKINDTCGHATGDRVIAEFAAILREAMPPGALLGRIGGEEFAVLLEGPLDSMLRQAEQARALLTQRPLPLPMPVTVSCGVSRWVPGESLSELMRRADHALYQAKRSGRNQICTNLL